MDAIIEKLKANWEFGVAGGVLLLTALLLGAYFLLGSENDLGELSSAGSIESSTMLSKGAFDFLTKGVPEVKGNPFVFPAAVPEPQKPRPRPKPQAQAPKPKPQSIEELKPEPAEDVKSREPAMEQATAQFVRKGSSGGRPMAIVKLTMQGGKAENLKLAIGDGAYGMKLLAIDEERIEVQDAKGIRGTIPRGRSVKLHLKR